MGKYSVVSTAFIIILSILLFLSVNSYMGKAEQENEALYLSKVIDIATDSALSLAVENTNSNNDDYSINPYYASEVFFKTFMSSYDVPYTEENLLKFYDYVPVMALIDMDGIYLGYPRFIDNKRYDFIWSEKIPYTYEKGNQLYALTLNGKKVQKINKDASGYTDNVSVTGIDYKNEINKTILSSIQMVINQQNMNNKFWSHQFYVPSALTNYGVVSFDNVSLVALVQGVDLRSSNPIDYFSIAGTSVTREDKIVAYQRAGKRYYCYASELPNSLSGSIENYYSSPYKAAEAGYEPDLKYYK